MKKLSNGGHVACEITLGPLGHTLTTPSDQSILGQSTVAVLDLHKCELNTSITEVVYQIHKLSLWIVLARAIVRANLHTSSTLNLQDTFFIP